MKNSMRVMKWKNGFAIRLPRSVVEALEVKEGDLIKVRVAGRGTIQLERSPAPQELLRRIRKYRGRLSGGFRFDRLEAHARQGRHNLDAAGD
jgi:antitoxin MazE